MKKLLLALLFALPVRAQTSIPIQNPSFEQAPSHWNADSCGPWFWQVPDWTITVLKSGFGAGVLRPANPNPCGISLPPDGITAAYLQYASISQDLGPASTDGIYTLKFYVADRYYAYTAHYIASLTVGSTPLCSTSGYAMGDFEQITLVCPTHGFVGDLTVTFTSDQEFQLLLDDISLTFTTVN
jgi:hypothetical protein